MRLSKMFKDTPTVDISSLTSDSRTVKKGDLYFALPGLRHDGHEFIEEAVKNGASTIVYSKDIETKPGPIYIKVDDVQKALNQAATIFYKDPASHLYLYGITGTNGKTSIASIIRHLENVYQPTGYIGTIGIFYGHNRLAPDLTTPDTLFLLKTLNQMVNSKMKSAVLEVSSHGLAQGRVDPLNFDTAIFTNFTYDHLDYHGTMEKYFSAKTRLFSQRLKLDGEAVLNVDDIKYDELSKITNGTIKTYGIEHEADYRAVDIELGDKQTRFNLLYQNEKYPVLSNLSGQVNIYNLLAAIAAVHRDGRDLKEILSHTNTIPQIPGRFERIDEGQNFNIVVDFAHTPDGMEKIMQYGKQLSSNKGGLIAVFGSAGQRDVAKRKVFGEIADKYCREVILTEDDPRDEEAKSIAREIEEGIHQARTIFISDRYEAIRQAIEKAGKDDTVLILGKGDEPFIYRENGRAPWVGDDVAARECVKRLLEE